MADGPIEPDAAGDYPSDMEARVAVLEQIARTTVTTLDRIERRLDAFETNTRNDLRQIQADLKQLDTGIHADMKQLDGGIRADMRQLQGDARADFRWLLGVVLGASAGLLGVMAHGFHWL